MYLMRIEVALPSQFRGGSAADGLEPGQCKVRDLLADGACGPAPDDPPCHRDQLVLRHPDRCKALQQREVIRGENRQVDCPGRGLPRCRLASPSLPPPPGDRSLRHRDDRARGSEGTPACWVAIVAAVSLGLGGRGGLGLLLLLLLGLPLLLQKHGKVLGQKRTLLRRGGRSKGSPLRIIQRPEQLGCQLLYKLLAGGDLLLLLLRLRLRLLKSEASLRGLEPDSGGERLERRGCCVGKADCCGGSVCERDGRAAGARLGDVGARGGIDPLARAAFVHLAGAAVATAVPAPLPLPPVAVQAEAAFRLGEEAAAVRLAHLRWLLLLLPPTALPLLP